MGDAPALYRCRHVEGPVRSLHTALRSSDVRVPYSILPDVHARQIVLAVCADRAAEDTPVGRAARHYLTERLGLPYPSSVMSARLQVGMGRAGALMWETVVRHVTPMIREMVRTVRAVVPFVEAMAQQQREWDHEQQLLKAHAIVRGLYEPEGR